MNQTKPITPLRDVLYSFSLAKTTPDAELLDEYVRRYPGYASVLTDFAIEMIVESVTGETERAPEPGELTVTPTVSRVMSRFQNRLFAERGARPATAGYLSSQAAPVENPFATLDRKAFRDLVSGLHANPVFVAKLRDREIDPDTMTDGFRQRVADEATAPLDLVVAHFGARSEIRPGQFYKADGKPAAAAKQTFEEAVRTSGLTEEQQRYLMSL
jgi:hypothetical protein